MSTTAEVLAQLENDDQELPHWDDDSDAWDTVFLAGRQMPGVATIKVSRKVKLDKKSAKGKNKAKVTKQGQEAASVTITLKMISRDDKRSLYEALPLIEPVADKEKATDQDALDISSYATHFRSIRAIIVEEVEGPELVDGFLTLVIKAVEFHKESKGTGLGGGGGLRFGFFTDQLGEPLPGTYVALEGLPATINNPGKPDNGKPLLDPQKRQVFVCQQKAILSEIGLSEIEATFIGRFHAEDPLIKLKWEEFHPPGEKDKDVTSTPKKSKGADLSDFDQPAPNDAPDPATTDAGPGT
jgi:hypothetical protein